jgi:N-acetylglucosamine kinase-like BadF-type ATPase
MPDKKAAASASYVLGFDGGGTKTDCLLMSADGTVVERATAGPSNPLRAGYAKAWFTMSDAADLVLERAKLKSTDIRAICAGIGGAGRDSVARRMSTFLEKSFPNAAVQVTTDLAITLVAGVGDGEGIILVVGTGSAALGRDAKGKTARAGGRGPWFSDEGSAFDIGRLAVAAVVRADEKRGPKTQLSEQLLKWLGMKDWTRMMDWVIKNPDDVFPRIFPLVGELADKGDAVSCELLTNAARSLGALVCSVVESLKLKESVIPIAKAGGTIGRSKFFDGAIDAELHRVAPKASVIVLPMKPAEAAARMALKLGKRKA